MIKDPDKMPIKIGNRIKNFFEFLKSATIDLIKGFNGESRISLVVEDWQDMITKNKLAESYEIERLNKEFNNLK